MGLWPRIIYGKQWYVLAMNKAYQKCDRAYENQPCERIKIAYFFQVCSVITYNPFV